MSEIFESNDYNEIKSKFEQMLKDGYRHIMFWIVSLDFYTTYMSDTERILGKRILINNLDFDFSDYFHAPKKIAGYEIVISKNFHSLYGINYVKWVGLDENNLKLLKE